MKHCFIVLFIYFSIPLIAQEKNVSLGLRGGGVSGLSIKLMDYDMSGIEIILGYQRNGFRMVGMVQRYKEIATDRIANLFFISGIGGHTGYIRYDESNIIIVDNLEYYSNRKIYAPIFGADMLIGFEYHFESVPINISLDYKPYFELFGEKMFRVDFWDIGFTLRYVFNN